MEATSVTPPIDKNPSVSVTRGTTQHATEYEMTRQIVDEEVRIHHGITSNRAGVSIPTVRSGNQYAVLYDEDDGQTESNDVVG